MSSSRWWWMALTALLLMTASSRLVYFERWLVDNDNYITLSSFFTSTDHPDYRATVRRYYDAAVATCAPGRPQCVAYAGALLLDQAYSRPLTAFFGSRLADPALLRSTPAFMRAIVGMTAAQIGVSVVLMAALLVAFLSAVPRDVATYLASLLAVYGFVGYWLPQETAAISFQPLLGVTALQTVAMIALAGMAFVCARWLTVNASGTGWSDRAVVSSVTSAAVLLILVRVGVYRWAPSLYFAWPVLQSQVGVAVLLLAVVGVALFVFGASVAMRINGVPRGSGWVALLLLLMLVLPGENFFITAFHTTQKGAIYLVAAPALVYAAVRPNGRLLWLLPALMLFHVGVAGLLFGCVAATEFVAGVRRRRATLALALSVPLCVGAIAFAAMSGSNPVVSGDAASISAVLARLHIGALLPGVVVIAILALAGLAVWREPDPSGDLLLRSVVLAAILAVAGQLAYALRDAGFDIMDPVAYNYIQLAYYLSPAVCAGGLFLVMLAVAGRRQPMRTDGIVVHAPAMMLIAAAVLALASARAGNQLGRPDNPAAAIATAATRMVTLDTPPGIDPFVLKAAAPNDEYVVGRYPGDPITMMAVLKMKCRSAVGLLDPARASLVLAPPRQ